MRVSLRSVLSRVERLAEDARRASEREDHERLVEILLEGRRRAARREPPRWTREESLARCRALRAELAKRRHAG